VVLGETGRNFGAGMTGGNAYVLDESETFERRFNPMLVALQRVDDAAGAARLRDLVSAHLEATGSAKARELLEDWDRGVSAFWRVVPRAAHASAPAHGPKDRRTSE